MIDINSLKDMHYNIALTYKCNLNCQHCYNVKTNESMSKEVLAKANEFICNHINSHDIPTSEIEFIGGEVGIFDQNLIQSTIKYIKDHTKGKNVTFLYQTNLVYELTDLHKEVIELVDAVGTSYDYNIRLRNMRERILWFNNMKYLRSIDKKVKLVITKTNQLIKNVTPAMLLDFLVAMDIHILILNSCMITNELNKLLAPKGEEVREWTYNLFLLYEKIKEHYNLRINEIENTIDSFYGNKEFIHARICSLDNITIQPNGDITTCVMNSDKVVNNLITGKHNYTLEEVFNIERTLNQRCIDCKYFCYCNGGCHNYPIDETGCVVPYKIYDYLKAKELINE